MTSRHERLQELFLAAEALPSRDRAGYLVKECPDPDLRAEVERLLGSSEGAATFLETPAPLEHGEWLAGVASAPREMVPPKQLGRYRVLEVLGEGGMGVVYLAEQEAPRRTVALKVLKPWAPGSDALRRFEFEAELLGRLQHPGIAQIFEAGTSDEGDGPRAFFAMEYIEGRTLLDYADEAGLDRRARIELVARIADAVQHAHERGIVHRDLKPANILVDASGQPKVLDFGVARATTGVQGEGEDTGRVELFGTLPYMSPEQLKGDSSLVDTRADEYALGVILYQLLSDRLPIPHEGRTPSGMMLSVLQDEPQRLGTIDPGLAGDLEAIAMKALAKEPDERYGSPAGLAADLRRHLGREPVHARPATRSYVASRFLQRNVVPVAAVASVILALTIGIVLAAVQAKEARAQVRRSEGFLSLFLDVLSAADPMDNGERDVRLSTVLHDAVERARERFHDRPADLATILEDVASSYKNLTRHGESRQLLEEAVEIRRAESGDDDPQTLRTQNQLAMVERDLGQWAEAEARIEKALAAAKSMRHDDYAVLISKQNLAVLAKDQGRLDTEDLLLEVIEGHERHDGPLHVKTLLAKSNLAMLYVDTGRVREAIPIMEVVLAGHRETLDGGVPEGRHHPETLISMDILGGMYQQVGDLDRARDLIRQAAEGLEHQLGPDHDDVMAAQYRLGKLLVDLGELDEAIAVDRRAFDAALRVHGEGHRSTIFLMGELGRALRENGDLDEAEVRLVRCVELCREVFPENHPSLVWRLAELARLRLDLDEDESALTEIEESLASAASHYEPTDWRLGTLNLERGRALTGLERFEEAERELVVARDLIETEHGPGHLDVVRVLRALAELYEASGQGERLAEIRALAPID